MSKTKAIPMSNTQPADWVDRFRRQASLEGMTFSEWVGLACQERYARANCLGVEEMGEMFPPRPGRGTPVRKGVTADAR